MTTKKLLYASSLFLLSILLLSSIPRENKGREIKVDAGIYQVKYSEKLEQPIEVWYTVKCAKGAESRKGMDFYTNDTIYTSSDEDYTKNDWDKGHIAPAADFSCDKNDLIKTFSYLNCALQHKDLNRNTWKSLEEHERKLSTENIVKVHVVIMFDRFSKRLPTGATVPSAFRKEISYGGKKEAYYFKNEKPAFGDFKKYLVVK
jgi:endonuclease G